MDADQSESWSGQEDHPGVLADQAAEAYKRYEESNDSCKLITAAKLARAAVRATQEQDAELPRRLNRLTAILKSQFDVSDELHDLEEAIAAAKRFLALPINDDELRGERLNNLGVMLITLHRYTDLEVALDEAIVVLRQCLSATASDDCNRINMLSNLAVALTHRYRLNGSDVNLNEAIQATEEALQAPLDDMNIHSSLLNNLGAKLALRFEATGDIVSINRAIDAQRQAIYTLPPSHPDQAYWTANLGRMLVLRYDENRNPKDLEEAIQRGRQAVEFAQTEPKAMASCLVILAEILHQEYQRTGAIHDLEEVVQISREGAALVPRNTQAGLTGSTNLAIYLENRFDATGDISDLETAIELLRSGVALTPATHLSHATMLINLQNVLSTRYQAKGSTIDLEESIELARKILDITSDKSPDYPMVSMALANHLQSRYRHTRDASDMLEAIRASRQAVSLTSSSSSKNAMCLSNLAIKLSQWYIETRDLSLLEEGLMLLKAAIRLTPEDDITKATLLNNLSCLLRDHFQQSNGLVALDEATALAKKAVELTNLNDPTRALYLFTLGRALVKKFVVSGDTNNLDAASDSFHQAWRQETAMPIHRFQAAKYNLELLSDREDYDAAGRLGKAIIDFLPAVLVDLPNRSDQQQVMALLAGVSSNVCAVLLESGQTDKAISYLERGRAVIIGQVLDWRNDISKVYESHPALAQEYRRLVQLINTPLRTARNNAIADHILKHRREAMSQLDICIRNVRSLEGHERFLLGQNVADIQKYATNGNIILVNVSELELSHAIIITSALIKVIRLPMLPSTAVELWLRSEEGEQWRSMSPLLDDMPACSIWESDRSSLRKAKLLRPTSTDNTFTAFLSRLWSGCVLPVLAELGLYKHAPVHPSPRIWWIGMGLASSIPFHAACDPSLGPTENTLSWAVSSYATSIKALTNVMRQPDEVAVNQNSLLAVLMPQTPGHVDLAEVGNEAREITQALKHHWQVKLLDRPSKKEVLEELCRHSVVHFACHGSLDFNNPSASSLALGRPSYHTPENLSVQEIFDVGANRAWLAYLSACSTAQSNVTRLGDENLHLASAFQAAGFSHIIASMWPAKDSICAQMAGIFYRQLGRESVPVSSRTVAEALHAAVCQMRSRNIDNPYLWAQYVHFGG